MFKAYRLFYQTPGKSDSVIVLVREAESLEEALSKKDTDYEIGDRWSKITSIREVPLSSVLVSSLSVTELLMML
jgi:hypothetical protein